MHSTNERLTEDQRQRLIEIAVGAIRGALDDDFLSHVSTDGFDGFARAAFVTVFVNGELRGCIGNLEPVESLGRDVARNAFRAAFSDPRFPPLSSRDLEGLTVHVSVLGPLEPFEVEDEDDLIGKLVPGEDGLVLVAGTRRGTFLPSVWPKVESPRHFVQLLKRKAGLGAAEWPSGIEVMRFGVEEFDNETPPP